MFLTNSIIGALKANSTIRNNYNKIKSIKYVVLGKVCKLSPLLYMKYRYKACVGKPLKLNKPETFDEKLIWLMLYWRHPLKIQCGDKYNMRIYVQKNNCEHLLTKLYGVYENSCQINYNTLPEKCVIKCTHGCGFNYIYIKNKSNNIDKIKKMINVWMKTDYGKKTGEIHYSSMKPRIICEEYLDDLSGKQPTDYKLYCFDGKVHCTLVCQDRSPTNKEPLYDIYDREWKNKLEYSKSSQMANRSVQKPVSYDEMVKTAELLSKPFPFVRIDYYCIQGKAIIGEMTFTPCGCIDTDYTENAQKTLGEMITLPSKIL